MKKLSIVIIAITSVASILAHCAYAEEILSLPSDEKAVILALQGDVKIKAASDTKWKKAEKGMALSPGYSVTTGARSWVEIGFGGSLSNIVRVKENGSIEIAGIKAVKIDLLKGEISSLVEKIEEGSLFEIRTPIAVCAVRGTGWDTKRSGKGMIADAYEESVDLFRLKEGKVVEEIKVESGKRGIAEFADRPIRIEDVPLDRIRDWKDWREGVVERRDTAHGGKEGSKNADVTKGERIGGYVGKEEEKKKVSEEELAKWDKWSKGELTKKAEEIEKFKDQFKVLLEKWREKISPDQYIVTYIKGKVTINENTAAINDRVILRKDLITLNGYASVELTDEKTRKIRVLIKQGSYQRTRFYLGDMNVPIKSINVTYDTKDGMTTVNIELQQLTFEVVVYEGVVHAVIDMPVSAPPIVTTIPPPPPPGGDGDIQPYEG